MLFWTAIFLVVALIAGVLGFGIVMGTAAWIAKACFVLFLVLFLVSLVRRAAPPAQQHWLHSNIRPLNAL